MLDLPDKNLADVVDRVANRVGFGAFGAAIGCEFQRCLTAKSRSE